MWINVKYNERFFMVKEERKEENDSSSQSQVAIMSLVLLCTEMSKILLSM